MVDRITVLGGRAGMGRAIMMDRIAMGRAANCSTSSRKHWTYSLLNLIKSHYAVLKCDSQAVAPGRLRGAASSPRRRRRCLHVSRILQKTQSDSTSSVDVGIAVGGCRRLLMSVSPLGSPSTLMSVLTSIADVGFDDGLAVDLGNGAFGYIR